MILRVQKAVQFEIAMLLVFLMLLTNSIDLFDLQPGEGYLNKTLTDLLGYMVPKKAQDEVPSIISYLEKLVKLFLEDER